MTDTTERRMGGNATMHTRGTGRVRTAVVWDALRRTVDELAGPEGRALDVIDAGGGTGGFAVPLAGLGHRVTVVDASPDALAALERRAAEAGVAVESVQGDAGELLDLIGPARADLVLCHSVLEYVDDPAAAMAAVAGAVRPGGAVSVLVAGRVAAALHRAVGGHFDDARRALDDPAGRWGDRDPVPLRFTRQALSELAVAAGLRVTELHGVRIFADLVPGGVLDGDPEAVESLIALESAAAVHPVLRDLATQLHLLARG
ncbi:methyltransferase domain-containing protein [Thermomonospora umbrina]|uniref:Methyltransferase family protein n=1 Tax=Thermomonospora umbrina TaxID=111806 RepID=A0A3D9T4P8_9ACTN|nr:methyltransferase domain-containing protein [Thermomonospora umbrina]REE99674.1 methyltransferase family protein [Thermomonospora umbrina]